MRFTVYGAVKGRMPLFAETPFLPLPRNSSVVSIDSRDFVSNFLHLVVFLLSPPQVRGYTNLKLHLPLLFCATKKKEKKRKSKRTDIGFEFPDLFARDPLLRLPLELIDGD